MDQFLKSIQLKDEEEQIAAIDTSVHTESTVLFHALSVVEKVLEN
jgi:hypothetical protein